MAFSVPTFNLTCNIHDGSGGPLRLSSVCNLAFGRRQQGMGASGTAIVGVPGFFMTLLLPAGTDVRSQVNGGLADDVEVPAGSGRFYVVHAWDDIGKGFANEHRAALLMQKSGWPVPTP